MRPFYWEGVTAAALGCPNNNPYRNYISTEVVENRDPERSFPAIFEYASDFDSGFVAGVKTPNP